MHLADVFVPFSIEAGQDAENLLGELRRVMQDEKAVHEAAAFTTGSGSGQPEGFVTRLLATTNSRVEITTNGSFGSADVVALQNDLPPRFQPRARWGANLATINEIDSFETANGSKRSRGSVTRTRCCSASRCTRSRT